MVGVMMEEQIQEHLHLAVLVEVVLVLLVLLAGPVQGLEDLDYLIP